MTRGREQFISHREDYRGHGIRRGDVDIEQKHITIFGGESPYLRANIKQLGIATIRGLAIGDIDYNGRKTLSILLLRASRRNKVAHPEHSLIHRSCTLGLWLNPLLTTMLNHSGRAIGQ